MQIFVCGVPLRLSTFVFKLAIKPKPFMFILWLIVAVKSLRIESCACNL